MATTFSLVSPFPTRVAAGAPGSMPPVAGARGRLSSYQLVDALVTIAAVAWFGTAAGWMVGEMHAVPVPAIAVPAAAGDMPAEPPHASAVPGHRARATIRLI